MSHTAEFKLFKDEDYEVDIAYNGLDNAASYAIIINTDTVTGEKEMVHQFPISSQVARKLQKFIEVNLDEY